MTAVWILYVMGATAIAGAERKDALLVTATEKGCEYMRQQFIDAHYDKADAAARLVCVKADFLRR